MESPEEPVAATSTTEAPADPAGAGGYPGRRSYQPWWLWALVGLAAVLFIGLAAFDLLTPDQLTGRTFTLKAAIVNGTRTTAGISGGRRATLFFDNRGHFHGNDSCNYVGGSTSMHGHTIEVLDSGGTLAACIPGASGGPAGGAAAVTSAEDVMRQTLLTPGTDTWSINGQELHLSRPGAPTLVFTTDDPLFPIV